MEHFDNAQSIPRAVVTPPHLASVESPERGAHKCNFNKREKGYAAQRGRDAFGTATHISASLFRRLSAFFGSTLGQDPKGAKYAVLPSGHAGFSDRAKRSEGRASAPIQSTPVSPCEPLCAIFLREPRCVPTFTRESKRGPVVGEVEKRLGIKFMVAALPDYSLLLVLRVHREPGNVCI